MPKFLLPASKPRNPLVAGAQFRQAGKHGNDRDVTRQDANQALKREFGNLDLSRNKPPGF